MADPNTSFVTSTGTHPVLADGFTAGSLGFVGNLTGNVTGNVTGTTAGAVAATTLSVSGFISTPAQLAAAAGTSSQANSTAITKSAFIIVTVTNSTRGVRLPAAVTGRMVHGFNGATTAALVYPATNDKIGASSTNAGVLMSGGKGNIYLAQDAVTWRVMTGA